MKRLFAVKGPNGQVVGIGGQGQTFFREKEDAKTIRDQLNAGLKHKPYTVTAGPDHHKLA